MSEPHTGDHARHGAGGHRSGRHGDRRRLVLAMALTGSFTIAEVVGGVIAGSLALLADAAHMVTDTVSLALAWAAFHLADRPADARRTYGFHRMPVLAAFVNGLALLAIVAWIVWEAIHRIIEPTPVLGGTMAAVAGVGLVVNVAAYLILHGGTRENLNLQGAALHVLGDLLGSVAALTAAAVILATGFTPIDPLLSLLVAAIVARSAWFLVRRSAHVLLEGTPEDLDPGEITDHIREDVDGVTDVHHVHAWSLEPGRPMLSLHVCSDGRVEHDVLVARVKRLLSERYGIDHATLQVEYDTVCIDRAAHAKASGQRRP